MKWPLFAVAILFGCRSAVVTGDGSAIPSDATTAMQSSGPTAAPNASSPTSSTSRPLRTGQAPPDRRSDSVGTLTFQFENDTFSNNSDNNFTAGFGFAWTTAAVDTMAEDDWCRVLIEKDLSFLPTVSDPAWRQFGQLALDMEMYTAQDTSDPDPPPDSHPYSGIIALDSAVYSISERTVNAYFLRIGLVGPATGAEDIQDAMHTGTGRPLAQAWHTQLSNELILNLFYTHQQRLERWTSSEHGFGADLTFNAGAGLGTYYIGANTGLQARLGFALPDNFERSFALALYEEVPRRRRQGGPFTFYLFAQATGIGVARYLPTDGNTWTSSRSGKRDDWYGLFNFGLMMGYGRFVLTYRTNLVGSYLQQQTNDDNFSAVTLSYEF